MRHLKAGRILGRTSAHRKALFRNLVTALIQREQIQTTLAKAKELRGKAEKTITLGKKGTLHARRRAMGILNEKSAVAKLFGPLAERYLARNGGYTRIIKTGNRRGDDAPMAIIELVDREGGKPQSTAKEVKGKKATQLAEAKDKKVVTPTGSKSKKDLSPSDDKKKPSKKTDPKKSTEKKEKKATKKKDSEGKKKA
tara:strand:+ start:176 stop:766 length:591 start_codon:yes stop_codon:yes gene_type:complete